MHDLVTLTLLLEKAEIDFEQYEFDSLTVVDIPKVALFYFNYDTNDLTHIVRNSED